MYDALVLLYSQKKRKTHFFLNTKNISEFFFKLENVKILFFFCEYVKNKYLEKENSYTNYRSWRKYF